MGRIAIVKAAAREVVRSISVAFVRLVWGDANEDFVDLYLPPGDDAMPLPGDGALTIEIEGADAVAGFHDTKNAGKAAPGEKRIYARDSSGGVKASIWLKGDGSIAIEAAGAVSISAPAISLGDAGSSVATAGDLVAVNVPLLYNSSGPCAPVNGSLQGTTGYAAIGHILPRQKKVKA